MNKYIKLVVMLLTLNITNTKVLADELYEKNKMPCIEGICLGDKIQDLTNVNWKEAKLSRGRNYGWKVVGDAKIFNELFPYLSSNAIDKKGIQLLSKIKGFCDMPKRNPIFTGYFTTKDGKDAAATFSLLPLDDGKSQVIFVSEIKKLISNQEISPQQVSLLQAEAQRRYPNSNKMLTRTSVLIHSHIKNAKVDYVYLHLSQPVGLTGSLLEFPGCTEKVKL
jgi:hypothetical protein